MQAYKLLRQRKDGSLGPLFINQKQRIPLNEWLPAQSHPTKGFAVRPGWHVFRRPKAPHLSDKGRVWVKCEVPSYEYSPRHKDEAWLFNEKGEMDFIPRDGHYRFPRPKHQGGEWILAGQVLFTHVLTPEEVQAILEN